MIDFLDDIDNQTIKIYYQNYEVLFEINLIESFLFRRAMIKNIFCLIIV